MIIYIDKTIGAHGEKHGFTEDEKLLFSDLVVAHQRGYCLLCGELQSIECLSKNLEGIHRHLFRKIRNTHYEMRAIMTAVETIIVLSYGASPQVPSFIAGKCRLINISQAINLHINSQCALVCENLDDCHFYELIAKWYVCTQKLKGLKISFHHELGGGDTLNTVFQKCVEADKTPTLCLVDGDIKHGSTIKFPNSPVQGETAKKVTSTYNALKAKTTSCMFDLYCLPIHEAENLIPLSVLDTIANTSVPDMKEGVAFLRKLSSADLTNAILYYDFKHGCDKIKSDPASTYWIEVAEVIGEVNFPCLCGKVLKKAMEVMQAKFDSQHDLEESISIDAYLTHFWREIGLKVFSWGCAHRPVRV